jgi:hypothetical protein
VVRVRVTGGASCSLRSSVVIIIRCVGEWVCGQVFIEVLRGAEAAGVLLRDLQEALLELGQQGLGEVVDEVARRVVKHRVRKHQTYFLE